MPMTQLPAADIGLVNSPKWIRVFLGGEVIYVSYPTDEMSADDKLKTYRVNNTNISRATVHHALIQGKHQRQEEIGPTDGQVDDETVHQADETPQRGRAVGRQAHREQNRSDVL